RTHHLRFEDLEYTGDAKTGALVETRIWQSAGGEPRLSLATRCDLTLAEQIHAPGATWLDRQLVARKPLAMADCFGAEVRDAMAARASHLESAGLAQRRGQGYLFARDLIETLKASEFGQTIDAIGQRTGLAHQPSAPGDYVSGIYRERVMLASGRF